MRRHRRATTNRYGWTPRHVRRPRREGVFFESSPPLTSPAPPSSTEASAVEVYSPEAHYFYSRLPENLVHGGRVNIGTAYHLGYLDGVERPLGVRRVKLRTNRPECIFSVDPNQRMWYTLLCSQIETALGGDKRVEVAINESVLDESGVASVWGTSPDAWRVVVDDSRKPRAATGENVIAAEATADAVETDKETALVDALRKYANSVTARIASDIGAATTGAADWREEATRLQQRQHTVSIASAAIASDTALLRDVGVLHPHVLVGQMSRVISGCVADAMRGTKDCRAFRSRLECELRRCNIFDWLRGQYTRARCWIRGDRVVPPAPHRPGTILLRCTSIPEARRSVAEKHRLAVDCYGRPVLCRRVSPPSPPPPAPACVSPPSSSSSSSCSSSSDSECDDACAQPVSVDALGREVCAVCAGANVQFFRCTRAWLDKNVPSATQQAFGGCVRYAARGGAVYLVEKRASASLTSVTRRLSADIDTFTLVVRQASATTTTTTTTTTSATSSSVVSDGMSWETALQQERAMLRQTLFRGGDGGDGDDVDDDEDERDVVLMTSPSNRVTLDPSWLKSRAAYLPTTGSISGARLRSLCDTCVYRVNSAITSVNGRDVVGGMEMHDLGEGKTVWTLPIDDEK